MAYTPIGWVTGDTITADKLNKMDNGWSVENSSTQLCSETVTTDEDWDGCFAGLMAYSTLILADEIVVTYDGTDYTCAVTGTDSSSYATYGGFDPDNGPDFSTYPFGISSDEADGNYFITETAGTHTVVISLVSNSVETSDDFQSAVLAIGALPLLCVSGTTTKNEMDNAQNAGRLMYFVYDGRRYIITSYDGSHPCLYITDTTAPAVTATITQGIFTVTAS